MPFDSTQDDTKDLFSTLYFLSIQAIGNPNYESNEVDCRVEHAKRIIKVLDEFRQSGNRFASCLDGKVTFLEASEEIRREALGGIRRYLPQLGNKHQKERVDDLCEVVQGARHYEMAHPFKLDNPLTGAAYALMAEIGYLSVHAEEGLFLNELVKDQLLAGVVTGFGALAGLFGGIYFRNGNHLTAKKETLSPRVWDAAQFVDAVAYFANRGEGSLAKMYGSDYRTPMYSKLPNGKMTANKDKVIKNLIANPFIKRMNLQLRY
ncbi:MAG TPA: hypothetical protein VHA12_03190 [Candidatus Nanoarchaeia archaeon]|nr:hypothetical protein [Candidatus Nanoarchaeia archaeon]